MTIRWDQGNVSKGAKRSKLVALNDLYATLCEIVNVKIPSGQANDSISFAKYLLDEHEDDNLREDFGTWRYKGTTFYGEAFRKGDLKLIHYIEDDIFELYNLTEDISENNNIALGNEDLVQEMFAELLEIGPSESSRVASSTQNRDDEEGEEQDPDDGGY